MMNRARNKSFLLIIGLFATGLLLAGCGSGGEDTGNTPPQEGSELTTFTFDLSSFSPQSDSGGTPAAIGDPAPSGGVEAKGAMLIVGPNGEQYLFSFNPFFDEAALTITATQVIKLDPGLYTFYMLLNLNIQGVTHQYAVIAPVLIFKAVENKVHLNLNPTLMFLNSVKDLTAFSRMTFDYPEDIKTWTHPRFGISIDAVNNGAEFFFNINKDTASGPVVIMLPSRSDPYIIKCRFYDGSLVRVVCPGSEEEVVLPPADQAPVEIEPVPLTAETTYSFTPSTGEETGDATFLFNIPKEIVDDVGGPDTNSDSLSGRLLATVTLVGPENTLSEQTLTLTPQLNTETNAISFYQASITVSGFDPGTITWSLNFFDIRNNGSQQFAYCAMTVDLTSGTDPDHGSFVCDLQFIDRTLTGQFPVGTVNVSVDDGSLVSGAVIIVDSEPVGITSSGTTENAEGTFSFFLSTGSHQVTARHEAIDPYGSGIMVTRMATVQTIDLTANSVQQVFLSLPPLAEPPKVTGSSPNQGAADVPVSSLVSITFSKPMDQGATEAAFNLSPTTAGALSWSGDSTVLTFTPSSDLSENTAHGVIVSTDAKDTEGIPLQNEFTLEFTTGSAPDTIAPSVVGTVPADQSTNVSVDTSITVTFSEAMNTASAEAALTVAPALSGTFSWSGDNSVMTFVPGQSLSYSQTYSVTVASSAADTSGNT
ncbi:MAG: Ig-like domain-containing protein, partial [SAR324 cluster bacterium]|nr:Ig-like domain-containing protein [SAR324 cluster bacterium]